MEVESTDSGRRRKAARRAWPRLRAAKLPFTIFVATDPIDRDPLPVIGADELGN